VHHRLHSFHQRAQRRRTVQIPGDQLDTKVAQRPGSLRPADQSPHFVLAAQQLPQDPGAHVAGGARHRYAHLAKMGVRTLRGNPAQKLTVVYVIDGTVVY
jgi:hypothetical protein